VSSIGQRAGCSPALRPQKLLFYCEEVPALVIVICGGGILSTGSLIHDTNRIILGAVFEAAGVGVGIWRLIAR